MKQFEGKTLEEAVDAAVKALGVEKEKIHYIIKSEKVGKAKYCK